MMEMGEFSMVLRDFFDGGAESAGSQYSEELTVEQIRKREIEKSGGEKSGNKEKSKKKTQ